MNPSSDAESTSTGETRGIGPNHPQGLPSNWREALMSLIASRISLIQLESKEAAGESARRLAYLIAAICAAVFSWALLIAGGVILIAKVASLPESWVAIGFGILHLLAAILLARLAKPSGAPAFPITRAEFQKDREWIENFKQTRKSNN
jgi:uncharacterized membrane protein YqjE